MEGTARRADRRIKCRELFHIVNRPFTKGSHHPLYLQTCPKKQSKVFQSVHTLRSKLYIPPRKNYILLKDM